MMGEGLPDCSGDHGHDWRTLKADVDGHGSIGTRLQQMCRNCGIIRLKCTLQVYVEDRDRGGFRQVER